MEAFLGDIPTPVPKGHFEGSNNTPGRRLVMSEYKITALVETLVEYYVTADSEEEAREQLMGSVPCIEIGGVEEIEE